MIGYKPTFGLIDRAGLKFLSESLDAIGTLTRTIPDAALIVEALSGMPATSFNNIAGFKPRMGFCRMPYRERADAATHASIEAAERPDVNLRIGDEHRVASLPHALIARA